MDTKHMVVNSVKLLNVLGPKFFGGLDAGA